MDDQMQEPKMIETEDQPGSMEHNIKKTRERRHHYSWIWGVVLVLIGVVSLLENLGMHVLENWWALFILIPAIGAFANAWRAFQEAGRRLTGSARSALLGGFILTMVAVIFLFNLNWALLGPILLILAGIGIFVNVMLPG